MQIINYGKLPIHGYIFPVWGIRKWKKYIEKYIICMIRSIFAYMHTIYRLFVHSSSTGVFICRTPNANKLFLKRIKQRFKFFDATKK